MMHIEPRGGAVRITVRAQPRASRTELAGTYGDAVRVRLAAPPAEGAANAELVRFLADAFGVPKGAVRVVAGGRGRNKVVEVEGVDVATARRILDH